MRLMKVFLAGLSALILSLNVAAQAQTEEGPRRLTVEEQEDRQERLKDRLESKDCFGHVHGKDLDPLKKKISHGCGVAISQRGTSVNYT